MKIKLISESCDLHEFSSKVTNRKFMEIMDATWSEISNQKKLYREQTEEREFPSGSRQGQYCEDLQMLGRALLNGSFSDERRPGLINDLLPLLNQILKEVRINGNIQQLVNEASSESNVLNLLEMNSIDPLVVGISREEVETCDIKPALSTLNRLISSPEMVRSYKERVEIAFDGYNKDHRELFEIPEVRNYVDKLDNEFPFWLFFLSKHYLGLQALLLCFLPPYLTEEGKDTTFSERIESLLEKRWFPAMNHICSYAGIDESEINILTERTFQYISNGPLPFAEREQL